MSLVSVGEKRARVCNPVGVLIDVDQLKQLACAK